MLEMILERNHWFVLMGAAAAVGLVSKGVVSCSLKRLTKAAENMGKSTHPLMRLVRAKYEHTCMISERVQNVEVFVEKYIYEYKIAGVRLHSWQRLERAGAWGCLAAGLLAAGAEYALRGGMNDQILRNAAYGAAMGLLLFLMRIAMDEPYRLKAIRTYMVDYLDNFCAHKYEKTRELLHPDKPGVREGIVQEPYFKSEAVQKPYRAPEVIRDPSRTPENPQDGLRTPEPIPVQKPYRAPEPEGSQEGLRVADRVRAAKESDMLEASGQELSLKPEGTDREDKEPELAHAEPEDKWPVRDARKREQLVERLAEKTAEKQEDMPRSALSKEVLIREILEEFLA